jgi:LacI family transcriptional regulator
VSVTSIDVARQAGVSQATVSRVLAGSARVNASTRDRVLAAVSDLGYIPNLVARAMKTGRSGAIGIVVAQLRDPFYPAALVAFGHELSRRGQRMVLFSTEASEEAALSAVRQGIVDGLVFASGGSESPTLRAALGTGIPVVLFNRALPEPSADLVTSDNARGARLVAEHLIELGHRRIAVVDGDAAGSPLAERRAAFAEALADAGTPLDPLLTATDAPGYNGGHAAITRLLALADPPTAVFAVDDITALGVIDGARRSGVRVPAGEGMRRLSVVGYDDIEQAAWQPYNLTTVRQPVREMAERCIELLLRRISQPEAPEVHDRYPARLVVRGSTAPPD